MVCAARDSCDLCESNYVPAITYSSQKDPKNVCMASFCGLKGKGETCQPNIGIPNCLKSQVSTLHGSALTIEDCTKCEPGYKTINGFNLRAYPNIVAKTCEKQEGSVDYDIFVKPSEERKLTDWEEQDIYRQLLDEYHDSGTTVNDAFYYLS